MSIRPIWSKPTLISEWGDDEQEERDTYWTSLFYDLIIVSGVSAISDPFDETVEYESGEDVAEGNVLVPIKPLLADALIQFLMLIIPWSFLNEYTSTFQDESLVGHMAFFVHLLGLATTAAGCVGELEFNYHRLGYGIILAKVGLILLYLGPLIHIKQARSHMQIRCLCSLLVIVVTIVSIWLDSDYENFDRFRIVLYGIAIWDLASIPFILLAKTGRLRIHIGQFTDRFRELTMIIFGEAIFSITLQSQATSDKTADFYTALAFTLWLIFSLALNEFDLFPRPDDHAMRRSIKFGLLWNYTMTCKTVFLLATSIGIKRTHYLVWADESKIDRGTQNFLFYGVSCTLFAVVLIRSYSFGWGRHPGPNDPPKLVVLKISWWTVTTIFALAPVFMDKVIILLDHEPSPLFVLMSLGIYLLLFTTFEAILSNLAAAMTGVKLSSGKNYLGTPLHQSYGSISDE